MKIAILVAGGSRYFPLFIDKPKSLYHLNGQIQLQKFIEDVKQFVDEKDIIIVAGYKYKYIKKFLRKYPDIKFKINHNYNGPAIYTFRKAIEGENDDIVFMFGDESISRHNISKICKSSRKLAVLSHDNYWYYSLGIMKLRADQLNIINDNKYLSMEKMKKIFCFANKKKEFDNSFKINSGICIGYIMIDFIRRIGQIRKIENPALAYNGKDIDFIHYNPKEEYLPDLDHFYETDEYKHNMLLRFYSDYISDPIRRIGGFVKRTIKKWMN